MRNFQVKSRCLLLVILPVAIIVLVHVSKPYSKIPGIAMSIETFQNYYMDSSRPSENSLSTELLLNPEIIYESIKYEEQTHLLTIRANISLDSLEWPVVFQGKLYNSAKQNYGINCVVGVIESQNPRFKVLNFEIWNSYEEPLFSAISSRKEIPTLRIYLIDSENTLYFFETDIPSELEQIKKASDDPLPNVSYDGSWFINIPF